MGQSDMDKELLFSVTKKDLDIQTFRSGGPGGQNQNKRDTGVRIVHRASGAFGESRVHKSQNQNKKEALQRLVAHPKFRTWQNKMIYEIDNKKTIEEMVEESIVPENLKIEGKKDGKWTEINEAT